MLMVLVPWVITGLSIILLILSVIKRKDTTPADYARLFELSDRFTRVEASVEQMQFATNSFNSFKELFAIPKVRGEMGQFSCEEILSNIFPNSQFINRQHKFSDGSFVDFLLCLNDMNIPIDSKFILFDDKNGSKKIKDLILKVRQYIKPSEGTTDFAMLFIPSDGIYSQIASYEKEDILTFAVNNNVLLTSPSILYAQLLGLRSGYQIFKIADNVKEIINEVAALRIDMQQLMIYLSTLEGHINRSAQKLPHAINQAHKIQEQLNHLGEN